MDEKISSSGLRHTLRQDDVQDIAECLKINDRKQIVHLGARLKRYTDRYFAAQQGLNTRLSPGGKRTFMRSLAGRIEGLLADLDKAEAVQAVQERYKGLCASELGVRKPSIDGLRGELRSLWKIADDIVRAPPHKVVKKGRPVLDHAVGSFMALFETMTGERLRAIGSGPGVEAHLLPGPTGVALRKVFKVMDPTVSETTLAGCVIRLSERFEGRAMRESDFDWISAIEDDGTFEAR